MDGVTPCQDIFRQTMSVNDWLKQLARNENKHGPGLLPDRAYLFEAI
jgi:hypothetical protein